MTEKTSSKIVLRQEFLDRRTQMTPNMRRDAAVAACRLFLERVRVPVGVSVAGYWPIRGEMDDLPILRELLGRGHRCALPHVDAARVPLQFRSWTENTEMADGQYGIPEPVTGKVLVPDVFLVPAVAFDAKGHRLGYGSGFYDRTLTELKKMRDIFTVGLAYETQLCAAIPAEETDVKMDMIVTDKKVYAFREMNK